MLEEQSVIKEKVKGFLAPRDTRENVDGGSASVEAASTPSG